MPNYFLFSAVLFIQLILMSACTSNHTNESDAHEQSVTESSGLKSTLVKPAYQVPEKFAAQLDLLTKAYLATKDALIASDEPQVNVKIGDFIVGLQQVDATTLTGEAATKWQEYRQMLERSATTLQSSAKLEEKRDHFEDLSQTMYALVTTFGAKATLYKEYCPMALNDKGAFWLSAQSEIRNPYFGDAMLECGEVQEVLQFEK